MDGKLAKSCGAMSVVVMKPTTEHNMAGMRCVLWKQFGKLMVIRYYSRTFGFINLYKNKDTERKYGVEVMPVRDNEFQTYEVHISDDMKDNKGNSCQAWIVSTIYFAILMIGGTCEEMELHEWGKWQMRESQT